METKSGTLRRKLTETMILHSNNVRYSCAGFIVLVNLDYI